jgi:exopolysaccharide biosynthesis predicted pyruvyltransferase EpsI
VQLEGEGYEKPIEVVPDVVFSTDLQEYMPEATEMSLDIGLTDSVLAHYSKGISIHCPPAEYIKRLVSHEKLVCGRFHAIVLASMLGIPFTAYASNTFKNSALFKSIPDEAMACVPDKMPESIKEYASVAKSRIEKMFETIADLRV